MTLVASENEPCTHECQCADILAPMSTGQVPEENLGYNRLLGEAHCFIGRRMVMTQAKSLNT